MIREAFNKNTTLFIPFIMSGYPSFDESTKAILALAEVGADIIELGVPFSDPVADGPINQKAAEVAIKNGVHLSKVVEQVKVVRNFGCKIPIILFSYFNPILAFGCQKFFEQAQKSGVTGVLILDLPPEEGREIYALASQAGLELILLVSPTTDFARLPVYASLRPSFIYYISRLSVTGTQQHLSRTLSEEVVELRRNLPGMKIAVGFGISSKIQARYVSKIADGVIIGSKLVSILGRFGVRRFKSAAKALSEVIHGGGV